MLNINKDQFLKKLDQVQLGKLELVTPEGQTRVFGGQDNGPAAKIEIRDWRVVSNLAFKGDVGFAEDYRAGLWDTDNLEGLLEFGLKNKTALDNYVLGNGVARTFSMLSYMLRLNTLKGSKKNIHAHYDLGNDFYKLWLDPTMTYSSAIFHTPIEPLYQGQINKYDRIVDLLGDHPGNVLEVGCGWGGFAERLLEQKDAEVKGITLSEEQHEYATDRLGSNAKIALEDYRHQEGKFDNIVSIEMFEAVGEKFWKTYFSKLKYLLKNKGKAVIQTITINDQDFSRYRKGSDFIRSYIFPGGMLPSPSRFVFEAKKAGLNVSKPFFFGQDYARTLEYWLHSFDNKREAVKALGFDDGFIRLWRFYLAGCIAGFKAERTNVMHVEVTHAT